METSWNSDENKCLDCFSLRGEFSFIKIKVSTLICCHLCEPFSFNIKVGFVHCFCIKLSFVHCFYITYTLQPYFHLQSLGNLTFNIYMRLSIILQLFCSQHKFVLYLPQRNNLIFVLQMSLKSILKTKPNPYIWIFPQRTCSRKCCLVWCKNIRDCTLSHILDIKKHPPSHSGSPGFDFLT